LIRAQGKEGGKRENVELIAENSGRPEKEKEE